MKRILLQLSTILLFSISVSAQVVYSEDFSGISDGTGLTGVIPNGGNASVTVGQGTANQGSGKLNATSDWWRIEGEMMEARDVDGTVNWVSNAIATSGCNYYTVSVDVAERGTMEGTDFISVDVASGSNAVNFMESDDFTSATANLNICPDGDITVTVSANNGAGSEYHTFDNVVVTAIPYVASDDITIASVVENCDSPDDGSIVITAASAIDCNIEYSIGGAFQSSNTFTGLVSGPYTVEVRSADLTCGGVVSGGTVTILCPLPVELTSFTATNNQKEVTLDWTTASELNNSHFDIEHSIDGANFRAIDEVIGNGTTQEKQAYSYTHTTPANGTNYYRLKQVDYDGAFEYSDIRVVEIKQAGKIVINPSAAIAEITVRLAETTGDNNQIGIYDMMGRTVMMSNFDGTLDAKTIDISNLQKGYYVVRVQAGSQIFTERFMKMVD